MFFTSGGSFSTLQQTLAGQAQKAVYKLKCHLFKFRNITVSHTLELFDKLVAPILSYASQCWAFCKADDVERVHTQFCKSLYFVKNSTQNDFIYGELGRTDLKTIRIYSTVKIWLKIVGANEREYINVVYKLILSDLILHPNKTNWASLMRDTVSRLGFYHVWLEQGVANPKVFLSILKTRPKDIFIQDWKSRRYNSTRALFL